jgi:hypothetical protein
MNRTPVTRRRAISAAAVLGAGALVMPLATAVSNAPAAGAQGSHEAHEAHGSHGSHGGGHLPSTRRALALHDHMRRLWEDHIAWTRLAIVVFAAGAPGFDATAARLLANQDDIGAAFRPYYGRAAAARLTALLRDHITIAVELLQAAKAGDTAAFAAAQTRWYANSDAIAAFLAAANPRWWPRQEMRAAMRAHLDQTLAEASHELNGRYADSVAAYDEIHTHILAMADVLSSGVSRQFPHRFR